MKQHYHHHHQRYLNLQLHLLLPLIFLYLELWNSVHGFNCFTCNTGVDDDDLEPCDKKSKECPDSQTGVQSCSTLLYFSNRANPGQPHVRKFCTSPGIAFGSALERLPLKTVNGTGFCQSVDRWISQHTRLTSSLHSFILPGHLSKTRRIIRRINRIKSTELEAPPNSEEAHHGRPKRSGQLGAASPPAPPQHHSSTLLCICTHSECNAGDFQDILSKSLIGDIGVGKKLETINDNNSIWDSEEKEKQEEKEEGEEKQQQQLIKTDEEVPKR